MSFFLLRQAYALYLVSSTIEPDLLIFISSLSSSPLLLWTPPTLKFPLILASLRLHSPSFALFYCLYGFRAPNFAASGRNIRFVFELTVCLAAEKILRNYKRKRRWNWESCNYGLITCPTRLKVDIMKEGDFVSETRTWALKSAYQKLILKCGICDLPS
ncbi:hypothetical protein PRUPE_1G538900 [Prunus persica]|uniref:Uncharacterized protein n=1 Tax=Prunus persica TaxID=3760 RepID=A0A251RHS7_PRUPE|nr:hypothetical protein PRUPE_1G538900 [Prunus persica]